MAKKRVRRLPETENFTGAEIKNPPTFETETWRAFVAAKRAADEAMDKAGEAFDKLPAKEKRAAEALAIREDLIRQFGPAVMGDS